MDEQLQYKMVEVSTISNKDTHTTLFFLHPCINFAETYSFDSQ